MKPINNAMPMSIISMVPIVRVGQHAGNKLVNGLKPLDDFEAVCLVDGEAHWLSNNLRAIDSNSMAQYLPFKSTQGPPKAISWNAISIL